MAWVRSLLGPFKAEAERDALKAAMPVGELTESVLMNCIAEAGCFGTVKLSYESGPYDIDRPTLNATKLARAILAAASTQPVREPLLWLPIESAPEGLLVAVGWIDKEDGTAHYDFDYLEDGVWQRYFDYYEHLVIAGAPGRAEDAPYTYWMDIAHLPAAHGITKKGDQ